MISSLLYAVEKSLKYVKQHTEIQFAFVLIIVLPLAFLYTSNQFLEAGRANQSKLQRDRVGLLHDSYVSLLRATDFDVELVQNEILELARINPDFTKFRIIKNTGTEFVPVAALDPDVIGVPEEQIRLFQLASVEPDESMILAFTVDGVSFWQAARVVESDDGRYFVMTENSFEQIDNYLHQQERGAYINLAFMYFVLLGITYWLIRLTNYRALYGEAKKAIETKDLFTNMIAHELRAPLTAMRGYSEMIQDKKTEPKKINEYAGRVQLSAERLLMIVNDLLDVARIQSGKISVDIKKGNVSSVLTAVIEELSPSAIEKSIALNIAGTAGEHTAFFDGKRLHQVVTNLVSNAIKYTKEGEIEISLEDKPRFIELRVKDTGMGISAEDQKQLFAPFFRVDNDDVSAVTGTGLGMWITRQLVELMGGSIGVESIKNVGTHVVVSIPKRNLRK